jgi:16S rRNA G527 N7-methylase RsmG
MKINATTSFLYLLLLSACCKNKCDDTIKIVEAKNKKIDSLQQVLEDCKTQAQIMAEILENERLQE